MRDVSKKVLVTGASGALGGALMRHLAATGVSRQPGGWRQAAVLDGRWLRPDEAEATIVHAAGPSAALQGPGAEAAAAHLAMVSALLAAGWRGRLVLLSSAAVYGAPDSLPVAETAATLPLNAYGAFKLAVERGLAAMLPPERLVILRLANVYGTAKDLSRRRVAALIFDALRSGAPFTTFGTGGSQRDYLHVADLCRAVALAVTDGAGVVNIGSGQGTTLDALIAAAEAVAGRRLDRRQAPGRAEAGACVLDIGHARTALDWQPEIALHEGLTELFRVMRA